MASVTGMTAEAIDEIFEQMLVSVRVDDNGQLIYKNRKGEETNGGPIVAPKLATEKAWPVGSIFISAVPTNPNTLTGVGVWARFGMGRTLISQNPNDADFDSPEEVGGTKTVQLTAAQSGLPYHAHGFSVAGTTTVSRVDAQMTTDDAGTNPAGNATIDRASTGGGTRTITDSDHNHYFSFGGATAAASANAAEAHSIMSPYIVVYVWKRTS